MGISIGWSGWDMDELEEGSAIGIVGLLCVGKRALRAESSAAKEFRSSSSSSTRRHSLISFSEGGVCLGRMLADAEASSYIWSVLLNNGTYWR